MKKFSMLVFPFFIMFSLFFGLFYYLKKDNVVLDTKPVIKETAKVKKSIRDISPKYNNYSRYRDQGYVKGGKSADGFDVYSLRWHKHNGFERLVFDISDEFSSYDAVVGFYSIGTEAIDSTSIAGELLGYSLFSAYIPSFKDSEIIHEMEVSSQKDTGYFFSISLKQPVSYKVFSLTDPARIIIDFKIR